MFNSIKAYCELKKEEVEIAMVKLKRVKTKSGMLTPVSCTGSPGCDRGCYCRFVNPLTTRLPASVETAINGGAEHKSA